MRTRIHKKRLIRLASSCKIRNHLVMINSVEHIKAQNQILSDNRITAILGPRVII